MSEPKTIPQLVFDLRVAIRDRSASYFTVQLFRLMLKADPDNFARLSVGFPLHGKVVQMWRSYDNDDVFFAKYEALWKS